MRAARFWRSVGRWGAALGLGVVLWLAPPGGSPAHPLLERGGFAPGMRGPTPGSARRLPLAVPAPQSYLPARAAESPGVGNTLFTGLLAFYRGVISPVDGDRCVMAPTCSLYAHQALREHGVLVGVLLTADRLLHEADEIPLAPRLQEKGETLYLDPLAANTYWLWDWLQ